jgi:selenium-dependent xanthine dehydrogenase
MFKLRVNGREAVANADKKLLTFLREDLRLTSVKDGCSEGACGACAVLVNGAKANACAKRVSNLEGAHITTVEGLDQREKDVYVHCFAEAGAVQCGFCIPGMVISAKALLAKNTNPSRKDVKEALRGNICRCTGYKKIEDAILMASDFFRNGLPLPPPERDGRLDQRFRRVDAREKVLGTGEFVDDVTVPGMLFAKALRSKYPRARVNGIDLSKAESHPECVRNLTAKDVPFNKTGHIIPDWDVMIAEGCVTRYVGDAVALACATSREALEEVIELIEVDYTELTPMTCPEDAMRPGAPPIHERGNVMQRERLRRGDAEEAIRNSKYVVTKKYRTPFSDHAFMEPECAIAMPDGADGLLVYSGAQSVYDERREIARMLKIPEDRVRCRSMLVGGGFGGKEDMSVQHHAALMAWHVKRPVKVKFSRQESLICHTKRHPMEMEFTTACDGEGRLTGMKAVLIADTGAYSSLGGPVLQRACTHAAGPYNYQNVDILGIAVFTNNVVAGAFRGFGVTQSCFAAESNLNLLAEMAGISPWEIRYKNAIRPGQSLPNGQIATPDCAMAECLEAVKDIFEARPDAGIACAFKNSGRGVGLNDPGRCVLSVEGGHVHVRTSAACMGQGMATVCVQMVCQATGIDPGLLIHERPDTGRTPDSGTSTASRQTVVTGEAVRRAASKLNEELSAGRTLGDLEGMEFYGEFFPLTDPMGSPKDNPVSHFSYGYAAQVVLLDGDGRVEKVIAAYDAGTPVNIQSVEGQIEGGAVMGLGFALTEDFPVENGYPKARFGTLGLMRAPDAPDVEVRLVRSKEKIPYAFGAKGVGELCLIPVPPACAHAYYRRDGKFRTSLPLADTFYRKTRKK